MKRKHLTNQNKTNSCKPKATAGWKVRELKKLAAANE